MARGAAYGDINNDGALDMIVTTNGGPAVLFRNTGRHQPQPAHQTGWHEIESRWNRCRGAVTAGNDSQTKALRSGSSYLSSSELVLTFGLATHTQADAIEIRWPSGQVDRLKDVAADQIVTVKEGRGVEAAKALAKR